MAFQKRDNSALAKKRALAHNLAKGLGYAEEAHTEKLKATLHHARCVWQTREDTRGGKGLTNQEYGERNICKATENQALLNPKPRKPAAFSF